jgi:hypothetical protein
MGNYRHGALNQQPSVSDNTGEWRTKRKQERRSSHLCLTAGVCDSDRRDGIGLQLDEHERKSRAARQSAANPKKSLGRGVYWVSNCNATTRGRLRFPQPTKGFVSPFSCFL